jgi:hypothetical protein
MKTSLWPKALVAAVGCLALLSFYGAAYGQAVTVNPGYKALVRPINYSMPLAPKDGARAVIVYGKNAPWTGQAAAALQKAVADWCGVTLDIADDRTVTSEDTWLLADAYRKTPLIVLGNAQDNRVLHALGTRYLSQSSRTWPGGDRYVIRSVFEPFVADVNYVVLEASTDPGMNAACAKFAELLKASGGEAKAAATIPPHLRAVGSVKDKWAPQAPGWNDRPAEWANMGDRSVGEMIAAFKGQPIFAGTPAGNVRISSDIWTYSVGGVNWGQEPMSFDLDGANQKAIAAMTLLGCRAIGGRTHGNFDHYGALGSYLGIRAVFNSAILSPEEMAELESCIVLSGALPLDYIYNNIGGEVGWSLGGRHCLSSVLYQLHVMEYAMTHCRMDEMTRKEVERRYDAARRTTARYVRSFWDDGDPYADCAGEDTLMQVSCLLHQGLMDNIRNGNLRRSADLYVMSVDNLPAPWGAHGNYIGLAGFTSGRGGMYTSFFGGGLVDEAAFYYDDPQYRWLGRNWADIKWSRGGGHMRFHDDRVGQAVKPEVPSTYDGVRALPFDERVYAVLKDPRFHVGSAWTIGEEDFRLPPEPFEKAATCVAFRDGFDAKMAYLYLATEQPGRISWYVQNNSIARFTDLSDLWLFTNTESPTGWSRNLMSISNGKPYTPHAGCTVEALSNVGEVTAVSSKEEGVAGTDWTRTIVHWRGHYFVVLDGMKAREDGPASPAAGSAVASDNAYVCRWRTTQMAALQKGASGGQVWLATAPDGNTMRIQNTDPIPQTSEYWECDGAARPYVLQQYMQAKLAKGQVQTCQNLMYVSGASRPDEFEARRAGPAAVLVKGRTGPAAQAAPGGQGAATDHLALIGTGSRVLESAFYTDGTVRDTRADKVRVTGLTRLSVKDKGQEATREIFWSSRVVNLDVDCQTGKAQVELVDDQPVQVKTGEVWNDFKSGGNAVTLAPAGVLHLALIGTGGQIPLAGFETDAAVYDVFGEKLHLAGATTLRVKIGDEMREILWAAQPVNAMVDLQSGQGEIEVRGEHALQVKTGENWSNRQPGRQAAVFAQANALPKVGGLLEAMWNQSKSPADQAGPQIAAGERVFEEKPASAAFRRPLRRLTNAQMTATPPGGRNDVERSYWDSTGNLEITLSLPQSTQIACLRMAVNVKRPDAVVGRNATQGEAWGSVGNYFHAGDYKFSLALSDDGFQKDIRKIDDLKVSFEETVEFAFQHYGMDRLPTWRIEIGQKARQVKLIPRATTKEKSRLVLRDLELYEANRTDDLSAKAIVADINGDGANELIVSTSQKELAAFDADGRRLWHKDCPGDIIKLAAADLDDSGKSQTLAYLGTERLLRIDADGAERPGGDLYKAQCEVYHGAAGAAGVVSLGAWGPDDPKKKEVLLYSAWPFRVQADGATKVVPKGMGNAQASARLLNLYPGEREVLATVDALGTYIWSPHRDADGSYPRLGFVRAPGFDGFERGGFALVRPIDIPGFKGVVTAILSGINYFPMTAFAPGAKERGWSFETSGVPAVAALVEDINGDGVPEIFLARKDGFVNILKLADGSSLGLLNLGEPILGMTMLKGKDGKGRLAVGTKFSVRLFAADPAGTGMKEVGRDVLPVPAAAFAGPGGKDKDRVFVVDTAGNVTVLSLK